MAHEPTSGALTEYQQQMRRVERVARLGLWEWDRLSGKVFWSEGMYRVFGRTPEGFSPDWNTVISVIYPDDRMAAADTLDRILATASSASLTLRIICGDGSIHWMQCEGESVLDSYGRVIGLCGTVKDITVQYAATEQVAASERMFRRLANSLPALIVYLDTQQCYRFVNHVWEHWNDKLSDAVLGRTVLECLGKTTYEQLEPYLNAALAGKPQEFELELDFPGSGRRYASFKYTPDFAEDGFIAGVFILVTDLTEQRRTEESLLQQTRELTEIDRRKDEFLAMLGHELRNPLTPIHNAAQILNPRSGCVDTEQVAWAARIITDQTHKLITLTDDLLDVARITHGQIRLRREHVDLREVITKAAEAARHSADERAQELVVCNPETAIWVEGDAVRLAQIVANLIRNSVAFTDREGTIRVSAASDGEQAIIRVVDNGIGISAEFLPRIFERFVQKSRYPDESQGGLGLGLHLCKHLTESQGGTIEARSAGVGQGTDFCVRLPLAAKPPSPVAGSDVDETSRPPPRLRVLIVDDNEAVAESMLVLLKAMGQMPRIAADGDAALKAVEDFQPSIVFLDIGLPDMDGFEVARRLRQKYRKDELILVALTGYGQSGAQCGEAGKFDRFLTKPASPSALTEVLREMCDTRS